jgi:hypothetical protein
VARQYWLTQVFTVTLKKYLALNLPHHALSPAFYIAMHVPSLDGFDKCALSRMALLED